MISLPDGDWRNLCDGAVDARGRPHPGRPARRLPGGPAGEGWVTVGNIPAWPGRPYPLGATVRDDGTNFALYASEAEAVELVLLDESGAMLAAYDLVEQTDLVWHGFVPRVGPGRALRLPRARRVRRRPGAAPQPQQAAPRPLRPGHLGGGAVGTRGVRLRLGRGRRPGQRASTRPQQMPHSVVVDDGFDWSGEHRPDVPWSDTVIYETHVRGFTMRHPGVPERPARHLRGPGPPRRHRALHQRSASPPSSSCRCTTSSTRSTSSSRA